MLSYLSYLFSTGCSKNALVFTPKRNKRLDESVVFSTHCSSLTLGNSLGAFRHKQNLHGCQHNFQILNQAGMGNIHQIHLQLIVGGGVILAIHLRITGQTSLCLKPQRKLRHLLAVLGSNLRALRAGTEQQTDHPLGCSAAAAARPDGRHG